MFNTYTKSIFINGSWQEINENATETVYNPATGSPITSVAYAGAKETDQAIAAALQAFPMWSEKTGRERSTFLYKAYQLMLEEVERLAEIVTMEQGKPLREAMDEVKGAAQFLLWYAEEASRNYGEWLPTSLKSKRMVVVPQPVGVVGAITPWNFPSSMITRKLAPALAAGCTAVLKPAPETPLSAIEIIKIFARAGMPNGVVNLVTGDAQAIGHQLLTNKDVRLITFTGSTAVGKHLMRESAEHVKKLSLELGGHAPGIVFPDADLNKAASLVLASKFRNNGQTCICTNRLFVHESVVSDFVQLLKHNIANLKLGNGLEKETDIGPLINQQACEKVAAHVHNAIEKGAVTEYGGQRWHQQGLSEYYFEPTILSNVTDDMKIMHEETFGPVLPIQTFSDETEVIAKANDTDYGLAAYIFTENTSIAIRVSEKLDYGIVGVNDVFPASPEAPFGGIKQSGLGKEGGHHGMDEFMEKKLISFGIKSSVH
ncbi:NAD-dependent succinate-semialdehyde dehydrogenase [Virgibacillus pantothenticus]|uniref:NAD-dependent succinate-semialdehyde dehydrogenase n=1 Tax=Virgibacillus pantothenticus TaxID=1473 RepID=UPI001B116A1D|nr:NAD-dependent succinate-semialdehyde dehydrogenase [Virgibacillus pantothenticus]GIP64827.1 NAD-dependent succinate-semialdehyde dehydrogenase [Virgibacillus pantothenticus]